MNILFLCTGNSCRSVIAEAIFNALAPASMHAVSAGSKPAGYVHPKAIAALQKASLPAHGFYSKSWDSIEVQPDIVITLCADAEGENCPVFLSAKAVRSHWGMPDPAKVQGEEAEIEAAFDRTVAVLQKRIAALVNLLKQPGIKQEDLQKGLDILANHKSE